MLGLGVDILKIERFKEHKKFAEKILSNQEMEYYNKITNEERKQEFVAGRFAAKEAVIKACDHIPSDVKKIDIYLKDNNLVVDYLEHQFLLSISHSKEDAIAFCVRLK